MIKPISKYLIPIIILIIPLIGNSQTIILEQRYPVYYNDVYNPIKVYLLDTKYDSFFLTTKNGEVQGDSCFYEYKPERTGLGSLVINIISNNDTIQIDKKSVRIIDVPLPSAKVNGIANGEISNKVLSVQIGVAVSFDDIDINLHVLVKSFRVIIVRGDTPVYTKHETGNRFSESTLEAFHQTHSNDIVYFTSIIGEFPGMTQKRLNTIELTIK